MANTISVKEMKLLVQDLEKQGCLVKDTTKGYFIGFPNGNSTTFHKSTSDHRAPKNMRSEVVRAGLRWLFDGGKKK